MIARIRPVCFSADINIADALRVCRKQSCKIVNKQKQFQILTSLKHLGHDFFVMKSKAEYFHDVPTTIWHSLYLLEIQDLNIVYWTNHKYAIFKYNVVSYVAPWCSRYTIQNSTPIILWLYSFKLSAYGLASANILKN